MCGLKGLILSLCPHYCLQEEKRGLFSHLVGEKSVCVCVFCFSFLKQKTSLEIRQIKIRQFWMVFQSQDCAMLTTGAAPFVSTNSD